MAWSDTISMYGGASAYVNADSNGGNDIELVAAVTGKKIVVDRLLITSSAAAATFLESGASTVIFPTIYTGAGGTVDIDNLSIKTAAGEALTFSSTITGNISVMVWYHILY